MQNVEKMSQEELLHVLVSTKHGPSGSGRRGSCDPDCAKCAAEKLFSPAALREERARSGAPGEVHIQPITIHADDPDRLAFGIAAAFTKKVTGEMAIPTICGPLTIKSCTVNLTQPGTVTFVGDPQAKPVRGFDMCPHGAPLVEGALKPTCCIPLIDGLTLEQCRERWEANAAAIESGMARPYDLSPDQIAEGKRLHLEARKVGR